MMKKVKFIGVFLVATIILMGVASLACEDISAHKSVEGNPIFRIIDADELENLINENEADSSVSPLYATCCDRPAQYYKLGLEAHGRNPDTNYCENIILSWYRTCKSCGIIFDTDAIFTTRPGCGYQPCVPLYPQ